VVVVEIFIWFGEDWGAVSFVNLRVNGRSIDVPAGAPLLVSLERSGVYVPHVCYNPSLGAIQTCDLCFVEVDGQLVRACSTPVREGMVVDTETPRVTSVRKAAMDRILTNHNLYCTICDNNNGDCELHNTVARMGVRNQSFKSKPYPVDSSNPFYVYDPNQCILCGRCVEACQDYVVNEVIRIDWSLNPPRVVWDNNSPIGQSSCVSCGTCATVCPVDAIMEKSMLGEAGLFTRIKPETRGKLVGALKRSETDISFYMLTSDIEAKLRSTQIKKTKTVCPFCAVGCSFEVWTKGRKILKVEPKSESPANGVATCIKGKFGWDFVNSPERLTKPLIREGDHFREASWEEAISLVARRLTEIKHKHGPDAIGVIATCTGTNEEAYLAQKLARAVIGTNNVDNCARYCQAPATTGLFRTVGIGGDSGTMADTEKADLVITFGSNTAEAHPVWAGKLKRAKKLRGQKLIVVDVKPHEMVGWADLFISPHPGTDLVVVNAIAKHIVDQGWEDREFIEKRTVNFEAYRKELEPFTLEYAERVTGVPRELIIRAATMIHEARSVCAIFAMGITQHQNGSETTTAISDLLLLTGNYGRPGTGAYPARGHANVQGTSDFGALPTYLPGYERVDNPKIREKYEKAWGVKLPMTPGLTSTEMVDAILDGRLRAMYIMGEDKVLADSNQQKVGEALSKVEFLVVQELFLTRTAQYADVILPAAASLEKDGTFVNTERRIQRLYKAFDPPGEAKADWEIIQMVANAMGAGWVYTHPMEIMDEVAGVAEYFAGVSYERLEGFRSLLWPVKKDGADSPLLYTDRFEFPDGRARFHVPKWIEPLGSTTQYDMYLDNGRVLEHFHWGNLTWRSKGIRELVPEAYIEISPEAAQRKGLKTGDKVLVKSRVGRVVAGVMVSDRVSSNRLYIGLHGQGDDAVNQLTGDERDPTSKTPAYKELPVSVEKLEGEYERRAPLPVSNYRHHVKSRVSQVGVKVEEKWSRADYAQVKG
jgi:formate dehydrogenase major subunit